MRSLARFGSLWAAILPIAALMMCGVTGRRAAADTGIWSGQLYTRAVWLSGSTPALQAVSRADLYTSGASGTLQAQGATWSMAAIVFKISFADTKLGSLVVAHTARVAGVGAYIAGSTRKQAVLDVTCGVPDTGTPTLKYAIYEFNSSKPDGIGAVIKSASGLTKDPKAGYAYIFLPLAIAIVQLGRDADTMVAPAWSTAATRHEPCAYSARNRPRRTRLGIHRGARLAEYSRRPSRFARTGSIPRARSAAV